MGHKKKDVFEEAKEEGASLEDFVIPQKIDAFVDAFQPVEGESAATLFFDETKLRTFFKAYPTKLGDPLTIYLSRLEDKGFVMKVGMMNEPAIFVTERAVGGMTLIDSI
jgi:hypothetical protein|nr:hypothetical protein [uncultured Prevotella sp.]